MTDHLDQSDISFSQAQGYEALPQPLKLEEISIEARLRLWDVLYSSSTYRFIGDVDIHEEWIPIFRTINTVYFKIPIDEQVITSSRLISTLKPVLLKNKHFNIIFDVLQSIMRHPSCPDQFSKDVADVFHECRLAYIVSTQHPATIIPSTTRYEGKATLRAMEDLSESGLPGTGYAPARGVRVYSPE